MKQENVKEYLFRLLYFSVFIPILIDFFINIMIFKNVVILRRNLPHCYSPNLGEEPVIIIEVGLGSIDISVFFKLFFFSQLPN